MGVLILRRLGMMVVTVVALSFIVFLILELDPRGVARKALSQFTGIDQREVWLLKNGYYVGVAPGDADAIAGWEGRGYFVGLPDDEGMVAEWEARLSEVTGDRYEVTPGSQDLLFVRGADGEPVRVSSVTRYFSWLGGFLTGDLGESFRFKAPVSEILWVRLGRTAILAGLTMLIMAPLALLLGLLAGVHEGSARDRVLSVVSIICTSVPEFASAVLLVAVFVFWLGWLPGTSPMTGGFSFKEIILPVAVLVLYGTGYIMRITRASTAEVMGAAFIRTAVLKGIPHNKVVTRHVLRNALITPVTVIMLQFPWLLSGVIVVEYFFAYKGFGTLIWEAAKFDDIYLIEACVVVTVIVVVATQLIADIIYTYINPRIRFK